MILPFALLSLASGVLCDLSFMDDGTHNSLDNPFIYPDEISSRELNINFNCSSPPLYARVDVKNSTQFPVFFGIPDVPDLYDVRPTFWVLGKTVAPSDLYQDSTADSQFTIPEGYTGYKVNTSENAIFAKFDEEDGRVKGATLQVVMVNITDIAPVYLVVENPGKINTRVWISAGSVDIDEELAPEVEAWFNSDTYKATTCADQSPPSSISTYEAGAPSVEKILLAVLAAPFAMLI